jgi:hypothetical protein
MTTWIQRRSNKYWKENGIAGWSGTVVYDATNEYWELEAGKSQMIEQRGFGLTVTVQNR